MTLELADKTEAHEKRTLVAQVQRVELKMSFAICIILIFFSILLPKKKNVIHLSFHGLKTIKFFLKKKLI